MESLRTSVLINCYNYERFVAEAIASVLKQTRRVDELIIVDDGSKDGSLAAIDHAVRGVPNAFVVSKQNEGQLSAFNAGFCRATGDILFFLDADDTYDPEHVANVCEVYEKKPQVDLVWTAIRKFDRENAEEHAYARSMYFGKTVALACMSQKYLGGVTSAVSIRRAAAARYMPVAESFYPVWRTRADDWLSHGSAVAGCTKYYLDKVTVNYRIHGSNNYAAKTFGSDVHKNYKKIRDDMYAHVRESCDVVDNIEAELAGEFRQHQRPGLTILRMYVKAAVKCRRRLGWLGSLSLQRDLVGAYFKGLYDRGKPS